MNFRTFFSSDAIQQRQPLRTSSSDITNNQHSNYQSTRIITRRALTSTNSSTFATPNIHHVRPLNTYIIGSDFSSNSPSHNNHPLNHANPNYNANQQILNQNANLCIHNNPSSSSIPPNILLPESLHYSSSAPYVASLNQRASRSGPIDVGFVQGRKPTDTDPAYNTFAIINGHILNDNDDDDEDAESADVDNLSFIDHLDDNLEVLEIESSSPSRSIYTNTPSVIPLVSAFRARSSISNLMVKPCSES